MITDNPQTLLARWPAGEPNINRVAEISKGKIWNMMKKAGPNFFADMPVNPWASELLAACQKVAVIITVTSGPPYFLPMRNGRAAWVARHCDDAIRYKPIYVKEEFAAPDVLLIDLSDYACKVFAEAGGRAVLWPDHRNAMHQVTDAMSHVLERIDEVANQVSKSKKSIRKKTTANG
ncbi:hypothetical protein [Anatilimnocola floriformis]|uniref:hypothetical protein n=1 Tax=Anatilimnocola floriformis TaxID=2948575 RepID=UPI0020C3FD3B|nr:hypothetical protein [Anatilimnocola floriformis]